MSRYVNKFELKDLFHVDCINRMCAELPDTTASAGYACPGCKVPLFPSSTNTGKIAEDVRMVFKGMKWTENMRVFQSCFLKACFTC